MSLGVPEKALTFLKKAVMIAPNEIKWQLLTAACYKRTGNHMKALQVYKDLHNENPDNIECLQLLVRLSSELGLREASEYVLELRRAEKAKEVRERIGSSRPGSRRSTGSRSSGMSPSTPNSHPNSAKLTRKPETELYQIQELRYDDPLGPVPERPRTSAGRKIVDDDFGDDDIADDLLPV